MRSCTPGRSGSLASVDALAYLERAGVEGEGLREALTGYAAVGEVHPYFLGLCADVALAAQRRGDRLDPASFGQSGELAGKQLDLARRLLAWVPAEVEYAILALSACRSFTYRTFSYLGQRRCRSIYAASAMDDPVARRIIRGCAEAGEQARLLPAVPMKMKLADHTTAMLPLTPTGTAGALVVRTPVIIAALREYFELLWERATPLQALRTPAAGDRLPPAQQKVLAVVC